MLIVSKKKKKKEKRSMDYMLELFSLGGLAGVL